MRGDKDYWIREMKATMAMWILAWAFCAGGVSTGLAQKAPGVPERPERKMATFADRSAGWEEVRALPDEAWRTMMPDEGNLGFRDGEAWVRMRFANGDRERAVRRVLEVPFARMDDLDWYISSRGELVRSARSGSMLREAEGALDARYPALPFDIGPGKSVDVYVRIATETVVYAEFHAWDADEYAVAAQRRERFVALRMGVLLALLILAYLFVWGFREVGSIWFPLTFTFFGIGMASLAGYWPDVDWMSCHFRVKTLMLLCSFFSIACLLMHARHFYGLSENRSILGRWMLGMALLGFFAGGISFWMPFRAYMRVAHLAIFAAFLAILAIAFQRYTRRASWWLSTAAYLVFFGYIFSLLAVDMGWLPNFLRADSSGFVAVSISMLLFILAQIWRLRELQAAYIEAVQVGQLERERRLADQRVMLRDLHDGLGGTAAAVSLMAAYGKRTADPATKNDRFEAIERMAGYAGAEIRSLMNTLEKPAPYWADWLSDMQEYANSVLEASRVELAWECAGQHPEQWEGFAPALSLMRVIKEALHNVVKHAQAGRVEIALSFGPGELEVAVNDNGKGFEHERPARGKGLANMGKRVKELGGQLNMNTTSEGTTIRMAVPLPNDGIPT